jgi:hypothetical protein
MWLNKFTHDGLKEIARSHLESLEMWLRRIADERMTQTFGTTYETTITNRIRRRVDGLRSREPTRFPRWVDATTFDQIGDIISGQHYDRVFKPLFHAEYPHGNTQLKVVLGVLTKIRNRTAHSNPLSARDVEKAICYSNDLIDLLKSHYKQISMNNQYNVPTIIRYRDSVGNEIHRQNGISRWYGWEVRPGLLFYPGESLSIEITVDSSFEKSEYIIQWTVSNGKDVSEQNDSPILHITFDDGKDVSQSLEITARIIQKKSWHKHSSAFDDALHIIVKVLPPPK